MHRKEVYVTRCQDDDDGYRSLPVIFNQVLSYVNLTRIFSCKGPKMPLKFFRLVAAIAAIQCVERGLIGVDDPISKRLPDLQSDVVIASWKEVGGSGTSPLLRPAETQVTLRQMLSHTSGISSRIFDPYHEIFKHG
jgi:hypothetical protein